MSSKPRDAVARREDSQAWRCALADGGDRVGIVENERLVWRCGDADLGARPSGDGFVEPDLLDEGRVFYQAEECGPGRHQRSACLLLGRPVEAMVEIAAVL